MKRYSGHEIIGNIIKISQGNQLIKIWLEYLIFNTSYEDLIPLWEFFENYSWIKGKVLFHLIHFIEPEKNKEYILIHLSKLIWILINNPNTKKIIYKSKIEKFTNYSKISILDYLYSVYLNN